MIPVHRAGSGTGIKLVSIHDKFQSGFRDDKRWCSHSGIKKLLIKPGKSFSVFSVQA